MRRAGQEHRGGRAAGADTSVRKLVDEPTLLTLASRALGTN